MNKALKKKWLKALRSGDYEQTTGRLKDQAGHCCLGVLCSIMAKPMKKGVYYFHNPDEDYADKDGGQVPKELLPIRMQEMAGVSENPEVTITSKLAKKYPRYLKNDEGSTRDLADLNDERVPFAVIADIIEECL